MQFVNVSKWLQTAVAEPGDFTFVVICSTAKQNGYYITNTGTTRTGAPLVYPLGVQLRAISQGGSPTNNLLGSVVGRYDGTLLGTATGASTPSLVRVASAGHRCATLRMTESTGVLKTNDLTAGDSSTVTDTTGVRDKCGNFRVGCSYLSGSLTDNVDILGFAIYSEALSDENLALVYNWFKTYYARRGISI